MTLKYEPERTPEWYEGGQDSGMTATVARENLDRMLRMTIVKEYLDENIQPIEPLPPDCKVPLRVVSGAADVVLPFEKYGQPLLDLLGLKSCVMLPNCGHNPLYDDPQGVAKSILDFTHEVEQNGG